MSKSKLKERINSLTTRNSLLGKRTTSTRKLSSITAADRTDATVDRNATADELPGESPLVHVLHHADGWTCKSEQHMVISYLLRQQRSIGAVGGKITPLMRYTIVDWMGEVAMHYQLFAETWSRGVQIMDMYCDVDDGVNKNNYQLVGVVALWIACKVEERYVPSIDQFVDITDQTCDGDEMRVAERRMLRMIDFNVNRPEPFYFVRYVADWVRKTDGACDGDKLLNLSLYICALTVQQALVYRGYTAAQVALASVILACRILQAIMPYEVRHMFGDNGGSLAPLIGHCASLLLLTVTASPEHAEGITAWFSRTRFLGIATTLGVMMTSKEEDVVDKLKQWAAKMDPAHRPVTGPVVSAPKKTTDESADNDESTTAL